MEKKVIKQKKKREKITKIKKGNKAKNKYHKLKIQY